MISEYTLFWVAYYSCWNNILTSSFFKTNFCIVFYLYVLLYFHEPDRWVWTDYFHVTKAIKTTVKIKYCLTNFMLTF